MNQLEQDLRDRTDVDVLVRTKIESIEQGKELIARIDELSKELLNEMVRQDLTNPEQKCYTDVRYDLKKAKQTIGSQLTKLVKAKLANR